MLNTKTKVINGEKIRISKKNDEAKPFWIAEVLDKITGYYLFLCSDKSQQDCIDKATRKINELNRLCSTA